MELAQQLYDTIRNHKKDDGSLLCDAFIRAPKRRQEPAYYEVRFLFFITYFEIYFIYLLMF